MADKDKVKGANEDVDLNDEVLEDVSGGLEDANNNNVNGNPNINQDGNS
jgi:hypothetical protein